MLRGVDARATAIHLEIWLDGESPTGSAYDDRGCTREFAGSMGLVAMIGGFLTTAQPGSAPPSSDERPAP
jgi:hypothetical protein